MPRVNSFSIDGETGKFTKNTREVKDSSPIPPKKPATNPTPKSGMRNTTSDSKSSKGRAEKKYNEIEYHFLEGNLVILPNVDTLKIKVGDTVNLLGLGKYLSGLYYVKEITRTISPSGFTQSAIVIKTDFGNSLKSSSKNEKVGEEKVVQSIQKVDSKTPTKTYTVKKGDSLWKIAKKFYGNGALYTKIYDANKDQIKDSVKKTIYVGQKFLIP